VNTGFTILHNLNTVFTNTPQNCNFKTINKNGAPTQAESTEIAAYQCTQTTNQPAVTRIDANGNTVAFTKTLTVTGASLATITDLRNGNFDLDINTANVQQFCTNTFQNFDMSFPLQVATGNNPAVTLSPAAAANQGVQPASSAFVLAVQLFSISFLTIIISILA